MNRNSVPKWQRELRTFLGIKSGIILEGSVYDEYPYFLYEGTDTPEFLDFDNLDQTVLSLLDTERTAVFFFDPVDGFYCYDGDPEEQRAAMTPLFDGFSTTETLRSHGSTVCVMPASKKGAGGRNPGTERYIWVSEIVRRVIADGLEVAGTDRNGTSGKENTVIVMNFASRLDACNLQPSDANTMFLNLMQATAAVQSSQLFCSSLLMVVDKYNDIPAWVYLNNPNIRTVTISAPDRNTRRLFLENLRGDLAPFQLLSREDYDAGKQFVAETEGMQIQEMRQILRMAFRSGIKPDDVSLAFRLYKYGVMDNPWENLENDILIHIDAKLRERVKGQDAALSKVRAVITRAVKGLSGLQHSGTSHKPKGILFFAGPTGVGKTETAKALAESIFGDENACIRFDMSEYRLPESDQKLFGAPPGYVGYEGGGQLTNAVKTRPFSVLLFDEIEKASPTIMDKFLQILEDGRMTDNQGNTVYFGETIIIFTSNIGLTKEIPDPDDPLGLSRKRVATITIDHPEQEDTPAFQQMVTDQLTEGVKSYFRDIGRPELLNRLGDDNIVIFQFINKKDAESICDYKLGKICQSVQQEKGIEIRTDGVRDMLRRKAILERANGGRGVGNMLEREFLNPLAGYICTLEKMPRVLRCRADASDHAAFDVAMA